MPRDCGVVPSPVFPGVLVSALRLGVADENSRSGRKKCGGNKSVYVTVSVSEDGARATPPWRGGGWSVCAISSGERWLGGGKGTWCTHTPHTRDLSNASCRTWRLPIIWRAGSRGMTRTPKTLCRKHAY